MSFEIKTGISDDGEHFAYVNHFGAEFIAFSEVSLEDAYRKLAMILSERLYRIGQIVLTGQIK